MARAARGAMGAAVLGALMASSAAASAGEPPRYSELPSGHLTTLPTTKKPSAIAAAERVAGFSVAAPRSGARTRGGAGHVSVVADSTTAEQVRKGERVEAEERDTGACFADSSLGGQDDEDDPESHEWSPSQSWQVNLWPRSKDNDTAGVSAVHRERLVQEAGGKATLESIDAWVDPTTRGARLIARASLPLVQVGSAVGGVTIYAGRDERTSGARYVHFVVTRSSAPNGRRLASMTAMRQDGNNANGGCGHLRLPLALQANDGDTAVVLAPVELSAPRKAKGERGEGAAKRGEPAEHEVRTRDAQIHLGVSQSSHDAEPRLSVSFGWSSREQVQRVTDDDDDES
jgi:hypothetical protein